MGLQEIQNERFENSEYWPKQDSEVLKCKHARQPFGCLRFTGMTGIFVGEASNDFLFMKRGEAPGPYSATGGANSITAARISYTFGLYGPALTIDTACSSSLVAMDVACKVICNHDCELAVAVGVQLNLTMDNYVKLSAGGMLSPRGRCATFSNEADGMARGEGCGAVVLKRLSKAAEDGDAVWGVLHGSAVNQDGRTATLTAPNGPAQEQVIRRAMERAGIRPDDVGYVEAHGTGTRLGDPLEVGALVNVFRGRETPLVVGAVKSNIGHLEGAAGMAGVIKAVLCLQNRLVPPNIHCERLNELLEPLLKECMCEFPRESIGLAAGVYAGVSSFGFGGTNAHVELGLAPEGTAAPAQPAIDWHRSEFPWLETNADVEATAELCNKDAGILAFEYYCPRLCVRAADIEQFHGQIGRYTNGRGQENVTFCSDDEDAVSMAMSALRRLVDRCQLQWSDIGRLEVGTECQVDRAKSIKTFLMSLFEEHGVFDVQGTDTYNACYGGTNALFNAINWVTGNSWNGKYAVVICSNAAVHPDPAHLSEIGASAVAMLIGPGAPMVIEPHKSTFIKNAWDFYRPIGWHNNDAFLDGDSATQQYEDALRYCLDSFSEAAGTRDLLSLYDMVVFHCNAPYHSKRSLALLHTHLYGGKLNKEERDTLYEQYAKAGTTISAQNATTYTCPLYACLLSLALEKGEDLVGKRVLCYSYGSGCAASLYGIRVCGVPQHPCGLLEELRSRVPKTVDETLRLVQAFEDTYGRFGFTPSHTADRQRGAYYLSSVDAAGVRLYEEHTSRGVQVDNSAVDVTRITLMQQTIDSTLVDEILEAIQPGRMHIITSACDNFCLGGSEGGEIDLNSFLSKVPKFGDLMTCLSKCDMPTIVVCHGATRGGGMLFPGIADIVLATDDASFGLPEIRRGVLPAVVSVALQKRLDCRTSRKWMLTGDRVNAVEAQAAGLVDGIVGTTSGETMEEALERVLHGLRQSPLHLLQSYKRVVASHGHLETAVVESGVGRLAAKLLSKDGDNVESSDGVVMSWPSPGICLISFTDTLQESNLSWGLVEGLRSRLPKLSESDGLKAIVLDASRVCLAGNVGLWDWIRLLNGSNEDLEVDTTASSLHRVASAYATLFTGVPVPVIMVVSGEVCGPGLAVALSADYRVAEPGARFNYACTESNQLFGVDESMSRLVGECEWAAVLREHEGMVHEDRAGELGLTLTCNSESSALDRALHLAAEVASAPSYGVRATLSLIRHQSDAGAIALRCVSLARSLLRKSVCNAALSNQQEMQEVREGGPKGDVAASTSVVVIDSKMTADELLNRLMTVSRQAEGQTIFVHVTEKGDLLETAAGTEALLSMLEWFLRPQPAVCVQYFSSTEEKSMLLALAADVTMASPDVRFRTSQLSPVLVACLVRKLGAAGFGLAAYHGDAGMWATAGLKVGVIDRVMDLHVDDVDVGSWVGSSISEAVISVAMRQACGSHAVGSVEIHWMCDGVARLRLPTVALLPTALQVLQEKSKTLKAVVFDATDGESEQGFATLELSALIQAFAAAAAFKRGLEDLRVPVFTLLAGKISALGALVACASDVRVGSESTTFDFTDPITACLVFTATDSLPRVIGAAAAERLKMQPSTIDSKRALTMRLITDVVENPSAFVDENVQEQLRLTGMGFRILPRGMALGASGEEDAERVIAAARFLSVKVEPVTEQHGVDGDMVSVEVLESVVHLFVRGHITLQTAKMISDAMQPASVVHVLHLTAYSVIVEEIDIEAVMLVVDCVKRCELQVVVEVTDTHTKADGSRLGEDVLLLIAASDLAFVSANISFSLLPPARLHPRFKAVVRTVDVEQEVKSVLARFRQLDSSLLRLCKKHLPAACAEEAYLVLDQLLVVGKQDAEGDGRKLVCLAMSDGVATIELNDVAMFNAMSIKLLGDLLSCILEVQQLVERGDVRAVVLQGAGPHFCTGGWQTESSTENPLVDATALMRCERIAAMIRSLPVPVIAAVHGKVIGGGLALALAADFRVCSEDTIFNLGNLPRGRNPLFLLSMSSPLTVGSANAMRLYLEDSQMSAQDSLVFGIVHATAPDTSAATLSECLFFFD